jgi:flagellar hook protein FlgE
LGDTNWAQTFASGQPLNGQAGNSGFGLIQSGALEASNVDITAQLVNMITAQRNFQANSQMISTADQITQTIINIR